VYLHSISTYHFDLLSSTFIFVASFFIRFIEPAILFQHFLVSRLLLAIILSRDIVNMMYTAIIIWKPRRKKHHKVLPEAKK